MERHGRESRRVVEVLDLRLKGGDFVCREVSIADFALYPRVRAYKWARVRIDALDNVQARLKRAGGRPRVERGLSVASVLDGCPLTVADER